MIDLSLELFLRRITQKYTLNNSFQKYTSNNIKHTPNILKIYMHGSNRSLITYNIFPLRIHNLCIPYISHNYITFHNNLRYIILTQ